MGVLPAIVWAGTTRELRIPGAYLLIWSGCVFNVSVNVMYVKVPADGD